MISKDIVGFVPFLGIVEDLDDPLKLGRVRVRVYNHHDPKLETDQLDWAYQTQPTTSAGTNKIGSSPTWLVIGSTVTGYYLDGEMRTMPLILGTLLTIPENDVSKHSVHPRAREEQGEVGDIVGSEPTRPYDSRYPYNKTISTTAGHLLEIDDTPGAERIGITHKSGSYVEISTDGRIVIKSVTDQYNITTGDSFHHVEGKLAQTVNGQANIEVSGSLNITSKGKLTIKSDGVVDIKGSRVNIQ